MVDIIAKFVFTMQILTALFRGLPVLSRSEVDRFLEKFYASHPTLNCCWYALYNAVLTSGCRALKMAADGESPASFQESQAESLEYFKNALSVHAEMLYQKTDLTAVQVSGLLAPGIVTWDWLTEGHFGEQALTIMVGELDIRLFHYLRLKLCRLSTSRELLVLRSSLCCLQ
jgi:hypothetical protein